MRPTKSEWPLLHGLNIAPTFWHVLTPSVFIFYLSCSFSYSDTKLTAILDQKHYIEELNRHLSGTVTDLQAKVDSLEKTNSKLVDEVRIFMFELFHYLFVLFSFTGHV